jgi:predicted CXXCH cytochrome family protein
MWDIEMKQLFTPFLVFLCLIFWNFAWSQLQKDYTDCTQSDCHLTQTKFQYKHSPLEGGCSTCHESSAKEHPVENKLEFKLVESLPMLCLQCHDMDMNKNSIHSPVKNGQCLDCHSPHGSDREMLLNANTGELCTQCHDSYTANNFVHGPVAGGMCDACHDPHVSDHANLLRRSGQEVCLFCHTAKKDVQSKVSVHAPFTEGCMDCHTPHSSDVKFLLAMDVPELCYECHETVEVALEKKSEVHGPFQKGSKCYLCHDAHVSNYKTLLQAEEKQLCFECHDKVIEQEERTIRNIKRCVTAQFSHAPVANDGCSVCHAAHTPDNFFLLTAAFPEGSYTQGKVENFAHCFDCHDSALMEEAETTDATNFRNGKRNLHYVHINREKARNCTTCHETHGSNYAFIIAEKIPFGKWAMPMKFTATATGGSCLTGCHKELGYNRNL